MQTRNPLGDRFSHFGLCNLSRQCTVDCVLLNWDKTMDSVGTSCSSSPHSPVSPPAQNSLCSFPCQLFQPSNHPHPLVCPLRRLSDCQPDQSATHLLPVCSLYLQGCVQQAKHSVTEILNGSEQKIHPNGNYETVLSMEQIFLMLTQANIRPLLNAPQFLYESVYHCSLPDYSYCLCLLCLLPYFLCCLFWVLTSACLPF